jgi:predicted dehydrogenase
MTWVILGVSSIATRRVLPALASLPAVNEIHLASRRPVNAGLLPAGKRGRVFSGYESALSQLEPGIAYVSLVNSLHAC